MRKTMALILILLVLIVPVVVAPGVDDEDDSHSGIVEKIILEGKDNVIKWETRGYSEQGFKVVWSKKIDPEYPTRDSDKYHYYTEPEREYDELEAFDGPGIYYVRVCEYLGEKCGVYSNEITLTLKKKYEYKEREQENESYEYKENKKSPDNKQQCNNGCILNKICYPLGTG